MDMCHISPQQLLEDSFTLGWQVYESGFLPDYIIGVWRGGAPVAIAIHELFSLLGVHADHMAIRAQSYEAIGQRSTHVVVDGLDRLADRLRATDKLLLVDDVHDTGLSLQQVIAELSSACGDSAPEIRTATPWFKPDNTRSKRGPDYFLHRTAKWLVFPHELQGLDVEQMRSEKPALAAIIDKLAAHLQAR